eukprot:12910063-Prorocentrum_lima.AAC.1
MSSVCAISSPGILDDMFAINTTAEPSDALRDMQELADDNAQRARQMHVAAENEVEEDQEC